MHYSELPDFFHSTVVWLLLRQIVYVQHAAELNHNLVQFVAGRIYGKPKKVNGKAQHGMRLSAIARCHWGLLLNESSDHCYLSYRKRNPTTDVNTSNATACLYCYIVLIIIGNQYTIDIYG